VLGHLQKHGGFHLAVRTEPRAAAKRLTAQRVRAGALRRRFRGRDPGSTRAAICASLTTMGARLPPVPTRRARPPDPARVGVTRSASRVVDRRERSSDTSRGTKGSSIFPIAPSRHREPSSICLAGRMSLRLW
jgi:hypothetical protein